MFARFLTLLAAVPLAITGFALLRPAMAADTITLITTGKGSALEWPLYIAMQKGFLAAHGVSVDLLSASSTAAVMQQVTGGSGDIGVGGLTDPIHAVDHGAALSVLMLETSQPPYSLWGLPAIRDMAALKGKTVIVGGAKDITRIYLERMTAKAGLKPGDYDLSYAGTTPARYAALMSGNVGAALLYPPATFRAASAGYTKLGEISDAVHNLPFTGYAVNVAWATQHPDAVRGFIQGVQQGVRWFYDPSHHQEAVDILVKASGADAGDADQTYAYFQSLHIYPDQVTLDPAMLTGLVQVLSGMGDLDGAADPARFIAPDVARLVTAAH